VRRIAIILAVLTVASCQSPAVKLSLGQCRADADKAYATAPDRDARVSLYLMDCMERHGFTWRIDDTHCADILGHDWASGHAECYQFRPKRAA